MRSLIVINEWVFYVFGTSLILSYAYRKGQKDLITTNPLQLTIHILINETKKTNKQL